MTDTNQSGGEANPATGGDNTQNAVPAAGIVTQGKPEDISSTGIAAKKAEEAAKNAGNSQTDKSTDDTAANAAEDDSDTTDDQGNGDDDNSSSNDESQNQQGDGKKRNRRGGFQKKLEKAQLETEFWKKQALEGQPQKPTAKTNDDDASSGKTEAAGDEEAPKLDDFDNYDDFLAAKAEHAGRKEARKILDNEKAEKRIETLKAAKNEQIKNFNKRRDEAREVYADFDDVVSETDAPMNEFMRDEFLQSPIGPHLTYYLAKNPAKAKELSKLNMVDLAREIARLEVVVEKQIPAKKTETTTDTAKVKTTKATPPIKPVNSGGNSSDPGAYNPQFSQAQFEAWVTRGGGK